MILLSLVLVITAAVLLVVGWFQDGLQLIYLSIAACLVSMLLLGASVLMRRGSERPPTSPIAGAGTAPASAANATTRRTAVVRRSAAGTATAVESEPGTAEADAPAEATSDPDEPAAPEPPADPLAEIRGLGPSRREALLARFGSIEAIRDAELTELTEVPGVSPGLARAVKDHLA